MSRMVEGLIDPFVMNNMLGVRSRTESPCSIGQKGVKFTLHRSLPPRIKRCRAVGSRFNVWGSRKIRDQRMLGVEGLKIRKLFRMKMTSLGPSDHRMSRGSACGNQIRLRGDIGSSSR